MYTHYMISKSDESETDSVCHKGISLEKMAVEFPEKYYIPFEHYNRVVEKLMSDLGEVRAEMSKRDNTNYLLKWACFVFFCIGIWVGIHRW